MLDPAALFARATDKVQRFDHHHVVGRYQSQ